MESNIKGIVGMIIPPPDMRAIIDRTAQFIAKQGPTMEKKIFSSDPTKIKFAFILPDNPFHPYYKMAVQSFKEGKTPEIPKTEAQKEEEEEEIQKEEEKPSTSSIATVEMKARYNPMAEVYRNISEEEPPSYMFTSNLPELYSLDLDVIRLTAQYTAINGRKFLDTIMNYQSHNPQFAFLKPNHVLNGFFTSLVEQYNHIIHFDKEVRDPLLEKYKHREESLRLAVHRMEYRHQEEARKKEIDSSNDLAIQTVDWNDFAVVETITFDEDNEFLPSAERLKETEQMEVDMETSERSITPPSVNMTNPVQTTQPTSSSSSSSSSSGLKIVENYEPKLKTDSTVAPKTMLDPLTKRLIPVEQANEHMRIELIDPMWKKQKEIRQERDATTNLVSGEEMTDTIHRMATKREEEFSMKRPSTSSTINSTEMTDEMIDMQMKRQRIKAMGISQVQPQATQTTPVEVTPSAPAPRPLLPGMAPPTTSTPPPPPPTSTPPPPPPSSTPSGPTGPVTPITPMASLAAPSMPMPRMPMPGMPMPIPGMPMPNMPMPMPNMPMPNMPMPMPGMAPRMPMPMPGMSMPTMNLIPEQTFIASHPGPVTLSIRLPIDSSNPEWKLNGQVISVTIDISASVKTLKQQISDSQGGMPVSKQQLKHMVHGFLKDNNTLGYYNFVSGTEVQLTVRSRGGRK